MTSGEAPNVSRVERQQRDDDPEADQVDEDREEDDEKWARHEVSDILYNQRTMTVRIARATVTRRIADDRAGIADGRLPRAKWRS